MNEAPNESLLLDLVVLNGELAALDLLNEIVRAHPVDRAADRLCRPQNLAACASPDATSVVVVECEGERARQSSCVRVCVSNVVMMQAHE